MFLFPSDKYPDIESLYQQSLQLLGKWLFFFFLPSLFVDKSISWLRQINFIQITPVREGGEKSVLVCQGCHSRVPPTGWLKQCISHSPRGWKSKVKVSAVLLYSKASLLGLQAAVFSFLHVHRLFPLWGNTDFCSLRMKTRTVIS